MTFNNEIARGREERERERYAFGEAREARAGEAAGARIFVRATRIRALIVAHLEPSRAVYHV